MLKVKVSGNVQKQLEAAGKSLPRNIAYALNDLAFQARDRGKQTMKSAFDRPTPQVLNSNRVIKATPQKLVATVYVGHNDPGFNKRLQELARRQEEGGTEHPGDVGRKAFSLPVTGGIRLNSYGNMPKGAVARTANRKGAFFKEVGKTGLRGLYVAVAGGLRLMAIFIKQVRYKPRLGWYRSVNRELQADFDRVLSAKIDQALNGRTR